MEYRPTATDWLSLSALVVFWGSSFLLTAIALQALSPASIVGARVVIGAASLFVFMRLTGGRLPGTFAEWRLLLAFSLLGNVIPFQLVAWAQQHVDSGMTGVLLAMVPLFVITLSHFVLPGERLTWPRLVGFSAGFAGVVWIVGPDSLLGGSAPQPALLGTLAILGAAISYAVNVVLVRLYARTEPLAAASGTLLISSSIAVPFAAFQIQTLPVTMTVAACAAVVALGLFSTGAGSVLYFRIVRTAGPSFLSLINYLIPLWAMLCGIIWLDETPELQSWIGFAFVLTGVAISQWSPGAVMSLDRMRGALARHAEPTVSMLKRLGVLRFTERVVADDNRLEDS